MSQLVKIFDLEPIAEEKGGTLPPATAPRSLGPKHSGIYHPKGITHSAFAFIRGNSLDTFA